MNALRSLPRVLFRKSRRLELPDVFPAAINRRAAWQLLGYGAGLLIGGLLIVSTGWVAAIPPFRSVSLNRVVFSMVALFGLYPIALGAVRLYRARAGIAGVSFEKVGGLRSTVSGLRMYGVGSDEISEFSANRSYVVVRPRSGRKRYIPVQAIETEMSPIEIASAMEAVLGA